MAFAAVGITAMTAGSSQRPAPEEPTTIEMPAIPALEQDGIPHPNITGAMFRPPKDKDGDRDAGREWKEHRRHHTATAAAPAPAVTPQQQPPPPPQPSGNVNWYAVAQCESGGNWAIDTGNGYYGGLQFTLGTWDSYGGSAYAAYPNDASAADQIAVADRVAFTGWNGNGPQGMGAWPVCGSRGYGAAPQTTTARLLSFVVPTRSQEPAAAAQTDSSLLAQVKLRAQSTAYATRRPSRGLRAYWWAIKQAGCPYVWGGNGPCNNGFDCSGLVQHAFASVGIYLPRTADAILHSGMIRQVSRPRKGDIAFLTSGGYAYHVMFWVHRHWVFAAADPAMGIGWFRQYGMSAVYRVV